MDVDFDNIEDHVISMDEFSLKWRFTDENYHRLPDLHLEQLKPLDKQASYFLSKYISKTNLHADIPFKRNFFRNIDKARISESNERKIKKWLYQRAIPFEKQVYLSWSNETAMIVPWKMIVKYFDDFYYGGSDDLTVIDRSLNWALLFFHEDEIYFGTNESYLPSILPDDTSFLY